MFYSFKFVLVFFLLAIFYENKWPFSLFPQIFKYISFNKTMTQLSSTLGRCAKDLAGFFVMFLIIFLAFTQLGYLLFGTQVKDFSSFENALWVNDSILMIYVG